MFTYYFKTIIMKRIFTYLCTIIFIGNISAQTNFCEDFENYNGGDPLVQTSSNWNSWDEIMNGSFPPFIDDVSIDSTMANSGYNSIYFPNNGLAGPEDVLLYFDPTPNINQANLGTLATPYTSGNLVFSQMMFIRTGAYLNFQAENVVGTGVGVWAVEVNFDATTSEATFGNTSNPNMFVATYPLMQWFEFKIDVDLSNNNWEVLIDGVSQGSFANSINQLASLDLYSRAGDEFWIDDVCYDYTPAQLDPLNAQAYSISPIEGLSGQQRYPSVDVRNFGVNNINSFDITFDYDGTQITENVTNINLGFGLSTMAVETVNFTNPITLSGATTATAYIYNINGGAMQSTSDDTITTSMNVVVPAAGKLVVGEEATGTWCGWCPRGAVALNWMDHDYSGYWQGIAVHNGDDMVYGPYDSDIGQYISGYPSALVDRGPEINPADFKIDFLNRITIAPKGIITNGAEFIDSTTLRVSLTVDFQQQATGAYKLACVLVEDSVTGSGPAYYQSNYYSGGTSLIDVDGQDWNQLPGNVPDYMMVYRHVARSIAPDFRGQDLSQTSYNSGDSETICYEFNLNSSWDLSQIHIVGMLINASGTDNASSTSIPTAIGNGYTECTTASTSIDLNGPGIVNMFPNPTVDKTFISNIKEEVTITVFDIKGKKVMKDKVSNEQYLDVSELKNGIYQIKIEGKDWTETRKLVKQ